MVVNGFEPAVNYERFPSKYFSGANVRIYFDTVFVDEITHLQFTLTEQVMPVYGFASYTYDDVFRGTRLVEGTFRINFRERDYLRTLLYRQDLREYEPEDRDEDDDWRTVVVEDDEELADVKDKLYGYLKQGWTKEFEYNREKLEKTLWRKKITAEEKNHPFFTEKEGGFEIEIDYGNVKMRKALPETENEYAKRVNPGTVKSINDIQLSQQSQVIELAGQPLQEEYHFIARDVDRE